MLWYKSLQHMTKYQWTESEFFHRSWMQTLRMIKRIFNFNDGPNVKNNISNSNSNLSNFTKENPDNSVVNFQQYNIIYGSIKLAREYFDNFVNKSTNTLDHTTTSPISEIKKVQK